MNYKVTVSIRGACNQYCYGTNLAKLEEQAVNLLTAHDPGLGSTWPEYYEIAESQGRVSGNRSNWKTIKKVTIQEIPESRQVWRQRKAEKDAVRQAQEAERKANECRCVSPLTGQLCTMARGHAGPHQVGGPYHTIESFVTQCPEDQCEYHSNQAGMSIVRWQECIQCGHRKPLHVQQYILETPLGAVELFAVDDEEAIEFAMKHLAVTRVTVIPGIPNKLFAGLKLFRYPMNYVDKPKGYQGQTGGLIEVAPFISALSTTRHV